MLQISRQYGFRHKTFLLYISPNILYNDIGTTMSQSSPFGDSMKFSFYTLGCKVNQYETQAMEQLLLQQGHAIGHLDEESDG